MLRLSHFYEIIGFDIDEERISQLGGGFDRNLEFDSLALKKGNISFTSNHEDLADGDCYIVTVPTPIDSNQNPNLHALYSATSLVAKHLSKGNLVIYESTVYPGATNEECVPILEEESGLKLREDFEVGYSPERVSPGGNGMQIHEISKIISATSKAAIESLLDIYTKVTDEDIHVAPSIEVAEFAKVLENTQRDLNIALINEVSHICRRMGLKTHDVVDAASTKWNFARYYPGLVGGHCIGVDPYYLLHKSQKVGYLAEVVTAGRRVNEKMTNLISRGIIKQLAKQGKPLLGAKVGIFGMTFKENCPDARNSKVFDFISQFEEYGITTASFDPYAAVIAEAENDVVISEKPQQAERFDAIIIAVGHDAYSEIGSDYFLNLLKSPEPSLVFDVKNIFPKAGFLCL